MEVVFSIAGDLGGGGKGYTAYQTALAIQGYGYLRQVFAISYKKKGIKPEKVHSFPLLKNLSEFFDIPSFRDGLFDFFVSLKLSACDIFHGWQGHCFKSLRKAKRIGAITFVFQPSVHPHRHYQLLDEEYKRFGIKEEPLNRPTLKRCLREYEECDYITVPSTFAYDSFIEQGIPKEKLFLLPYGVDRELFRPGQKKDETFRILFVGALSLGKGIQYLLEAVSQLKLENWELVLCGWRRPDIVEVLEKYRGLYRYIGMVEPDSLPGLFTDSSILVFPSLSEGSALVVYEAMACGLPVIVTPNTGSIVRDGEDGFIVPIRDSQAIKERILYLYGDEKKRQEMGCSARRRTEEYTWQRYGEELIKAYDSAIQNRG